MHLAPILLFNPVLFFSPKEMMLKVLKHLVEQEKNLNKVLHLIFSFNILFEKKL